MSTTTTTTKGVWRQPGTPNQKSPNGAFRRQLPVASGGTNTPPLWVRVGAVVGVVGYSLPW